MSDELTLRELAEGDVEALVEIALAAWVPVFAYYRQALGDELYAIAFPAWQEDKARQIRTACAPGSRALVDVAELGGRPVGFVTCYPNEGTRVGEIGNNAVHPAFQGRGIAPQLYQRAFARLRAAGMRAVRVRTGADPAHAPARRAYEKVGFSRHLPWVEYFREL